MMDRALLTGESAAIDAQSGDSLQAGEVNIGAPLQMRATAVGEDTSLRRMAALVETAENGRNSYTALADRAAQIYARDDVNAIANRYGRALTQGLTVQDVQEWPDILQAVTGDDIIAAAKMVLKRRQSVTGWVMGEGGNQ